MIKLTPFLKDLICYSSKNAVTLPASKSIGARFLVASYFAGTLPADPIFDDCDDLKVMQNALLNIYSDEQPIDYGETPIDVHSSGTAFRFVTAVCASTPEADFVITGTPRLTRRPMQPLIDVLREAGATIESQSIEGTGPYRVRGNHLEGGEFSIPGDISSQFISALMLVAPTWEKGMKLNFTTEVRSRPYIEMTAKVMEAFGIKVNLQEKFVEVPHATYVDPGDFKVEADWSAAAFFYGAAYSDFYVKSIAGLLPPDSSMQGDSAVANMLSPLGIASNFNPEGVAVMRIYDCRDSFELDLSQNPDLLPALAVPCAIMATRFKFTGVRTLRFKECNRLEVLKEELEKMGYPITIGDDFIEWEGGAWSHEELPVDPHGDHRMAMAFALSAYMKGSVRIKDPDVVEKSFARFWEQLPKIGLYCTRESDDMMLVETVDNYYNRIDNVSGS